MFHSKPLEILIMNNLFKNIALAATLLVSTTACNDVLDLNDTGSFGDVAVWSSQTNADAYVTAAYKTFFDQSIMYSGNNSKNRNNFFDNYSDIMKSNYWWTIDHNQALMEPGYITKGNARCFDCWSGTYGRIKRTNILLNDLERYGQKWGDEWYNTRRAEARFCNAINYFFLARVYGGVVLRTDHSGGGGWADDGAYESDKHRARISEEATYDYIISELQWCADNLPEKWDGDNTGRATVGIVNAFLSRIALYCGKWQIAADAAEVCAKYYDLAPEYAKLFNVNSGQDNSKEIIYSIKGWPKTITSGFDSDMRPCGDRAVYANGGNLAMAEPTAELVDMYEFADGTKFDWNTYAANHADPYTDREPRFHATVLYNGAKWENRTIQTYVGANANIPNGTDSYVTFATADFNADGHTVTGYYLRKYIMENDASFVNDGSYNTEIIIRYAEVLLNKAEALAKLNYGANIDAALAAVNKVRDRVDLPAIKKTEVPTLDDFMKVIFRERAVELAGEGLRSWDLRRWRLAESVLNGKSMHGHKVIKQADGSFTYETVDIDAGRKRIFTDKYYYLPLPTGELAQNQLCNDNNW